MGLCLLLGLVLGGGPFLGSCDSESDECGGPSGNGSPSESLGDAGACFTSGFLIGSQGSSLDCSGLSYGSCGVGSFKSSGWMGSDSCSEGEWWLSEVWGDLGLCFFDGLLLLGLLGLVFLGVLCELSCGLICCFLPGYSGSCSDTGSDGSLGWNTSGGPLIGSNTSSECSEGESWCDFSCGSDSCGDCSGSSSEGE